MQCSLKPLNLVDVRLQQIRVVILPQKVWCELGDVEDLDVIERLFLQSTPWSSPAVVVGFSIVAFIFRLLLSWQFKEMLCQGKLAVDSLLASAEVFDIEKSDVVDRVG